MNKQEIEAYEFLKKLQKMCDNEDFRQNDVDLEFLVDYKDITSAIGRQIDELKAAISERIVREWEEKKDLVKNGK